MCLLTFGDFFVTNISLNMHYRHDVPVTGRILNPCSPKVLVHRLEEEFVVGLVQDLFKIQQSDIFGSDWNLHQIRRLLFVDVINYFGFRHFCGCFPPFSPPSPRRKVTKKNGYKVRAEVALNELG